MLSIEETLALGTPSPEFEKILKADPPQLTGWTKDTDIIKLRGIMAEISEARFAARPDPSTLPFIEEETQVTVRDGASITVRIHRPRTVPEDGCPVWVAFHGGGYIIGHLDEETAHCRVFTSLGGIAVNVAYRLSPEHPFPIPVNDCFDAVKWTIENAKTLGLNLEKGFILGGQSAGADLALGVAYLYSKEKLSPPLTGIYSAVALAATEETVPEKYRDHYLSMEQNAHAPILMAESVQFVFDNYKPDPKSPVAWPIISPDLSWMPKTYFLACGMDPLRDGTLILEQVCKDAGIPTKLDLYAGLPHGFWSLFPDLDASRKHSADLVAAFRWLLS